LNSSNKEPAGQTEPAADHQIHGSLVEVMGVGVMILGPSGVGKSECVIELVRRGQRLVADDVVRLRVVGGGAVGGGDTKGSRAGGGRRRLIGWSPEHIRHYIEVRGLGLMSVSDLFGPEATLDECVVGFVVRLENWDTGREFDRIGLDRLRETFVGVEVPTVILPVHAASNLATLVELAVRDWRLRERGVNAARRLDERLRSRGGILGSKDLRDGEGI
jgi:HPr kinase/phosphorylase